MKRADHPTLKGPLVHIGLQIDRSLHDGVRRLAQQTGVSVNFAVRRALIAMVNSGEIPMPHHGQEAVEEAPAVDDQAQRLNELEQDFLRLQDKIAALRGTTGATPVFSGHRTGAGPKRQIDRRTKQAAPLE